MKSSATFYIKQSLTKQRQYDYLLSTCDTNLMVDLTIGDLLESKEFLPKQILPSVLKEHNYLDLPFNIYWSILEEMEKIKQNSESNYWGELDDDDNDFKIPESVNKIYNRINDPKIIAKRHSIIEQKLFNKILLIKTGLSKLRDSFSNYLSFHEKFESGQKKIVEKFDGFNKNKGELRNYFNKDDLEFLSMIADMDLSLLKVQTLVSELENIIPDIDQHFQFNGKNATFYFEKKEFKPISIDHVSFTETKSFLLNLNVDEITQIKTISSQILEGLKESFKDDQVCSVSIYQEPPAPVDQDTIEIDQSPSNTSSNISETSSSSNQHNSKNYNSGVPERCSSSNQHNSNNYNSEVPERCSLSSSHINKFSEKYPEPNKMNLKDSNNYHSPDKIATFPTNHDKHVKSNNNLTSNKSISKSSWHYLPTNHDKHVKSNNNLASHDKSISKTKWQVVPKNIKTTN